MTQETDQDERWQRLTLKQREVLDLVLERNTSKEIARIMGISMYAVDLRLAKARATLGARNRAQAALIYERLRHTYSKTAYGFPLLPAETDAVPPMAPDEARVSHEGVDGSQEPGTPLESLDALFADLRRRDHNKTRRTIFMILLVGLMVIIILMGLGIAQTLSKLISV